MGGRGAGKTRSGAEWIGRLAREGLARRIALVAPTFHDVREACDGARRARAVDGGLRFRRQRA
jgi:phage terminase large subunit-like protein